MQIAAAESFILERWWFISPKQIVLPSSVISQFEWYITSAQCSVIVVSFISSRWNNGSFCSRSFSIFSNSSRCLLFFSSFSALRLT